MKKLGLIALIPMLIMVISMLAPMATAKTFVTDTTTLQVGTITWGPMDADPVRAYDTSSGELIFNAYDTLIRGNQEKYWEFTPHIATNVPTVVQVLQNFVPTTFPCIRSVVSEEPYPFPLPTPVGTWWKDDFPQPMDSMKIDAWVDTNQNGILDASDMVFINDYWYAEPIPAETQLKDACWYHVDDAQFHQPLIKLVLSRVINGVFNPAVPYDTWFVANPDDGFVYRLAWWVDNNPDQFVNFSDCVYMMMYQRVPVVFDKIGPGFILIPVTCRTWHVVIADATHLNLERFYYEFTLTTTPVSFVDETGAVVGTMSLDDAVYSFQRGLVQDQGGSPQWMFYKPFFDTMTSDDWEIRGATPEDLMMTTLELSYMIKDAVEPISGNLRLNLGFAFPDNAWKQILGQTWGAIMDKEYSISLGCWNGNLFQDLDQNSIPDWWELNRRREYDQGYDVEGSWRWVGTGPYYVELFDQANNLIRLKKNTHYWKPWPSGRGPAGAAQLETVEIHYITDYNARKNSFIACDYDVCAIPRAFMFDLLNNQTKLPNDENIRSIANIRPNTAIDAIHFCFTIAPTSPYIYTGVLGSGIPSLFFNNTHARRAFAYAFNWSNYIRDNYFGEAQYRGNILVDGLAPDYYNKTYSYPSGTHFFTESLAGAQAELQQVDIGGLNAWTAGFTIGLVYNQGNDMRRIACEYIANFFTTLSGVPGTHGTFTVNIIAVAWNGYSRLWRGFQLPLFCVGWLADFGDADNFIRPYMNSYGDFCAYQNYSTANGWGLPPAGSQCKLALDKDVVMDLAIKTPDGPLRAAQYNDLQIRYYEDCPGYPIGIATGRRWCKYYVRGWYYNGLYPSQYYFDLWKSDVCWYDICGAEGVGAPGISDGKDTVKDISYLIRRFNALPPDPAFNNPLWVGTYGNGGVDPGPQGGDRVCSVKDITFAVLHFNHAAGTP